MVLTATVQPSWPLKALRRLSHKQKLPGGTSAGQFLFERFWEKAVAMPPSNAALLLRLQDADDDAVRAVVIAVLEEREVWIHDVDHHMNLFHT